MASVTSLTVSLTLSAVLLALAGAALADDPVYIWRDASGAVRFSPIHSSESNRGSESPAVRDGDPQPAIGGESDVATQPS